MGPTILFEYIKQSPVTPGVGPLYWTSPTTDTLFYLLHHDKVWLTELPLVLYLERNQGKLLYLLLLLGDYLMSI